MAKATTTIRQVLNHQAEHSAWFAANQALFNRVAAFYFEVIAAHEKVLDLPNKDALTALEKLTHTTQSNPHPVMPLSQIQEDIPAMFRRAAINAALGSARSFYSHLGKWRKRKERAEAKGKKYHARPPVPPRSWNKSATLYAGQWKERTGSSIMLKVWTELGEGSYHWPRNPQWGRDGKPATHQKRQSMVVAYSHREAIQEPCKDREASYDKRANKDLLSRSQYQQTSRSMYRPNG